MKEGRIEMVRVLVYRESRGGEVRFPAFLNQFKGMGLDEKNIWRATLMAFQAPRFL